MATEIVRVSLCDLCLRDDIRTTEIKRTAVLAVDQLRRQVDLCASHADLADALEETLRAVGNPIATPASSAADVGEFKCPRCGRAYDLRSSLRYHLKTTHGLEGATASRALGLEADGLPCDVCGFVAATPTGFAVHRRAKHPDAPPRE